MREHAHMAKIMLRAIVGVFAFGLLSLSASGEAHTEDASRAKAAEPITVAMTADHWQAKENAEFLRQLGFFHGLMRLISGDAVLKGVTFSDGTIEFDVNTVGRGAPGIAFRSKTKILSSSYTSGLTRTVRPFARAYSMRPSLMASCSGTYFHSMKTGRRSGRTGGTTSRWSYPADA